MSYIPINGAYRATLTANVIIYVTTIILFFMQAGASLSIHSPILISIVLLGFCVLLFLPSKHRLLHLKLLEGNDRQHQRLLCRDKKAEVSVDEYFLDDTNCYISPFGVFLKFVKHSEIQTLQVYSRKGWTFLAIVDYASSMIKKRWYAQEVSIFIPIHQLNVKTYRRMCRILIWH